MAGPIKRAAVYIRVSTEEQVDGTSLDSQREACVAYCKAQGWSVAEVFADEGFSGTKADRPGWRSMLDGARDGKFDAVVVAKLDRWARNSGHAITEMDRLTKLGVAFVSIREGIDVTTSAGRMARTLFVGFAEFERDTILERTVPGQRAKAKAGGWPGGTPPFGWAKRGEGRACTIVPNDEERAVIRRAVELVLAGSSTGQAADLLNAEGLRPRRAARWTHDMLQPVLRNSILHTGISIWGKIDASAGPSSSRHVTRMNHQGTPIWGEPIKIQLPDPPMTMSEWGALQRALDRQVRGGGRPINARPHPLSSRLIAPCGNRYTGINLGKRRRVVYRCTGRRHYGTSFERCVSVPGRGGVWGRPVRLR